MPDVHPLIRLVMLLVFAAGMALAQPVLLISGLSLLLLVYWLTGTPSVVTLFVMIKRLRWLFLAIFLIYGWWTPGSSVLPAMDPWSPTFEGMYQGVIRVLVLVGIVIAVHLLLQTTPRERLLPAIMQLLRPITSTAVRERLAVRMLLAIETVPRVQTLAIEILNKRPDGAGRLSSLSRVSRHLYRAVLNDAAQSEKRAIEVRQLASPAAWQWLIPLGMCGAILLAIKT